MRRALIAAVLVVSVVAACTLPAAAQEHEIELSERAWSFNGVFGRFDRGDLQRGFQVYREVCSGCHSLNYLAFRNLRDLNLPDAEIEAIAAEYLVTDGPDLKGEMFERPAKLSDRIPPPYPNDEAARYANGGALPIDLSVVAKARPGGAGYLYALLTGFDDPPEGFDIPPELSFNRYFPGQQIAMFQPLFDDMVEYPDGTRATAEQMAHDVTTFLTWISEPTMEQRKRTGMKVVLFLLVLAALTYAIKRRIWANVH